MPTLSQNEKTQNSLKRLISNRIKKNKLQKYPRTLDVLAHDFWIDFPKFRDENLDKIDDKLRLTRLFDILNYHINYETDNC